MLHRVFQTRNTAKPFMVSSVGTSGVFDALCVSAEEAMKLATVRMKEYGGSVTFAGRI